MKEDLTNTNPTNSQDTVVVKTDTGAKDGQNKCPKGGVKRKNGNI